MNNPNHIQQGDVLFRRIDRLPDNCKRLDKRTVALGEHTGHHHTFDEGVERACKTVQDAINWRAGELLPNGTDWQPAQLT